MKKNQIASIVLIMMVSLVVSYLVVSSIFNRGKANVVEVKTIDRIESTVEQPQKEVFHKDAINPAVQVFIGVEEAGNNEPKK